MGYNSQKSNADPSKKGNSIERYRAKPNLHYIWYRAVRLPNMRKKTENLRRLTVRARRDYAERIPE